MRVVFREATEADIPAIVAMLSDDILGQGRETKDLNVYLAAFAEMQRERGNVLYVGEMDGEVIATYQMTLISGLSLTATTRAQVESVRVATALRGRGIGTLLMQDAEARARAGGAGLMQFNSNKTRKDAHKFYAREGYVGTHEGFKKTL